MGKTKSQLETRLRVLTLATEIASEAAQNTSIVWMIEFQEELVERLYRRMMALLEDGTSDEREDANADEEDEDEDEEDEMKALKNSGSKKRNKQARSES